VRQLDALPGWAWDARQAAWEDGLAHLISFEKREGHVNVPASWREDGYRLGAWVNKQRTCSATGTLRPDRRARLEAIPGWTWDARQASWEFYLGLLERFFDRERHARVPAQWREDAYRLGAWVNRQRTQSLTDRLVRSVVLGSKPFWGGPGTRESACESQRGYLRRWGAEIGE
jgi:hypothetical protein